VNLELSSSHKLESFNSVIDGRNIDHATLTTLHWRICSAEPAVAVISCQQAYDYMK
jgi:hypothetical protein